MHLGKRNIVLISINVLIVIVLITLMMLTKLSNYRIVYGLVATTVVATTLFALRHSAHDEHKGVGIDPAREVYLRDDTFVDSLQRLKL